jgi:hypothetical protein
MKPFKKVLMVCGGITLLLLTIAELGYALTDIPSAAASLKESEAKARAAGLFITPQEYIDSITVPDSENAASIMAPVLKKYEAKYKEAKFEDTSKKTIDRPLVLAAYADLAPEWKQIDEAAKFKYCIFPRDRRRFAYTLYPEFANFKRLVRLACHRARIASEQNDAALAALCWSRAAHLSLMVDDEPILIGMLVRVACAHIIEDSIRAQLASQGRNPSIRAAAWQALRILDKPQEFLAAMRYEHVNTVQNLESLFKPSVFKPEDGEMWAMDTSLRAYSKIPRIREASLSNLHMLMAGFFERVKKDDFEFQSIPKAATWVASIDKSSPSFTLSEMIRPELYTSGNSVGHDYARRNTLMQAIKLLGNPSQKDLPLKGRYTLDSDGNPLRLIRKNNKLIIYCLGPNDADDGGIIERPTTGNTQDYDFGLAIPLPK